MLNVTSKKLVTVKFVSTVIRSPCSWNTSCSFCLSVTQNVSTVFRGLAPGIDGGGARQRRHDAHRKVQKAAGSPGMIYPTWIRHVIVSDCNCMLSFNRSLWAALWTWCPRRGSWSRRGGWSRSQPEVGTIRIDTSSL